MADAKIDIDKVASIKKNDIKADSNMLLDTDIKKYDDTLLLKQNINHRRFLFYSVSITAIVAWVFASATIICSLEFIKELISVTPWSLILFTALLIAPMLLLVSLIKYVFLEKNEKQTSDDTIVAAIKLICETINCIKKK